ncbi:MAG: hypothetical protein K0R14_2194 [Burkholderiales bacterium]|jgi:hypothetical protein|nr:hypothetical protein [Burkholderiales bacterium]
MVRVSKNVWKISGMVNYKFPHSIKFKNQTPGDHLFITNPENEKDWHKFLSGTTYHFFMPDTQYNCTAWTAKDGNDDDGCSGSGSCSVQ